MSLLHMLHVVIVVITIIVHNYMQLTLNNTLAIVYKLYMYLNVITL